MLLPIRTGDIRPQPHQPDLLVFILPLYHVKRSSREEDERKHPLLARRRRGGSRLGTREIFRPSAQCSIICNNFKFIYIFQVRTRVRTQHVQPREDACKYSSRSNDTFTSVLVHDSSREGAIWWRHFARDVTRFQRYDRDITRHARRDEMRDDAMVGRKS